MKTYFLRIAYSFILVFSLFACNNQTIEDPQQEDNKQNELTFEERLCHKWECRQVTTGNANQNLEDNPTYFTFLKDGKLLFESEEVDEVKIYKWEKKSDKQIVVQMPTPTEDLDNLLAMLPMLELEGNAFLDTLSMDADVTELTDTTLVLSGIVMMQNILTEEAIEKLNEYELTKGILLFTTKYTLYLRKDEAE